MNLHITITAQTMINISSLLPKDSHINNLVLSFNDYHFDNCQVIGTLLQTIAPMANNIHVRFNTLAAKSGNELSALFSLLPDNVVSCDLSDNELGLKPLSALQQAFRCLPALLQSLNLANNNLVKKTIAEFNALMNCLPAKLRNLNLAGNKLALATPSSHARATLMITRTLKLATGPIKRQSGLHSERAYQRYKSGSQFNQLLSQLPTTLTILNLANNNINEIGNQFSDVFLSLPPSIKELDLSDNNLIMLKNNSVTELFKNRLSTVETLTLASNGLSILTLPRYSKRLKRLLNNLSKSIVNLDINDPHIMNINNEPCCLAFSDCRTLFPSHIRALFYDNQIKSPFIETLLQQVQQQLANPGFERFDFTTINIASDINESCLNQLIAMLERRNDGMSLFVGALLLAGEINTFLNDDDNHYRDMDTYHEKRWHDAISLFFKAAKQPTLAPVVDYFLWHYRLTTTLQSIKNRLYAYDFCPPSVLQYATAFNLKRPPCITPLPRDNFFFNSQHIIVDELACQMLLTPKN